VAKLLLENPKARGRKRISGHKPYKSIILWAQYHSQALKVAELRKDSNFLLTTILWGNVGINVLLTLLSESVMAGIIAFLFSTFAITIFGEIIPKLKVQPERSDDDVIDEDIILFWGSQKRIITGSDIMGRLMRGIVQNRGIEFRKILRKET
jgi:hypothetical protein